jgi:hypothetical protein
MKNGASDRAPDALRWLYAHDPAALDSAAAPAQSLVGTGR